MKDSILLSDEHGVNPSILVCPLCGSETGVALLGKIKGDKKSPKYMSDIQPCDECKERMKTHMIIVEAEPGDGGHHLVGGVWYVALDAAAKIFKKEIVDNRCAFVTTKMANQIKLPRKVTNENFD